MIENEHFMREPLPLYLEKTSYVLYNVKIGSNSIFVQNDELIPLS